MPTPQDGYHTADGTRVPGVTTIIGRYKDAGGLIHWAWQLGRDGQDYREVRDSAANVGTIAHAMVEAELRHGTPPEHAIPAGTPSELADQAMQAYRAWVEWRRRTRITVQPLERPLVSEVHRFGGTPDAIGKNDGRLSLVDIKTSNKLYPDYLIQCAAYVGLYNEIHPARPITDGADLLRFSRDFCAFQHYHFGPAELEVGWRQFLRYREAYEDDKLLKRIAV